MKDRHEQRSSDEIRRDIDRTRSAMDETVDALGSRLSPGELMEEAWGAIKGQGRGAGDVVRDHPVPLALMGLGVAWLAIERATGGGHDSVGPGTYAPAEGRVGPYRGDAVSAEPHDGSIVERAKEKVTDAAHAITDTAREAKHRAGDSVPDRDSVRDSMEGARERARDAKQGVRSFLDEQPLAAAAVTFGIGLAAGLSAPTTRWEDEKLGRASETLKHEAKETARDAAETVKDAASDGGHATGRLSGDGEAGRERGQQPWQAASRTRERARDDLR